MTTHNKLRLIQSSFLLLFVELVILRWAGANLYYLFAFSNIILIASFLGIGIGFLRAGKNRFYLSPLLLVLVVFLCYHFSVDHAIRVNPVTDNIDYTSSYFHENLYPVWITLPIIFCIVVALMMTLTDGVKNVFKLFPPLQAYRLETLGSLSGLIVFSLLSWFQAAPFVWGIVIILCYINLAAYEKKFILTLQIISLIFMTFILVKESNTINHYWSAYYKIVLKPFSDNRYAVDVNGLVQQIIESADQRKRVKPFYMVPYQYQTSAALNNVLVIGAGTGGDVAIALSLGAKHVDAVEIDPMLYHLGKKFNPDHPYNDPRVTVYINDGRAFLQQHQNHYDMIIYALTDSLMLIMGQSSLRLENFLYTREGMESVAKHLTPQGIFTIYNYIQPEWLVNRLAATMQTVFHHAPCIKTYSSRDYHATVLAVSLASSSLNCPLHWQENKAASISPVTDNYPFLYLQNNQIPLLYLVSLSCLLIFSLLMIKFSGCSYRGILNYPDLFLMGTAFLLLETKNVIHFALLFGTTWFVNALVFIGIIFTVYLAIEFARLIKQLNQGLLYCLLLLSLLLAYFIPDTLLLNLPLFPRFICATALAFSPIFIANLIFADRFRYTRESTAAFGANLIGAVLGGILEYISLVIGYHYLFIVIAVIYTAAVVVRKRV
jgi:spermidine synthase